MLSDRLRAALPPAMKARDRAAVRALRSALAAIDNAEAVTAPEPPDAAGPIAHAREGLGAGEAVRRALSEGDRVAIVAAEIAGRRASAEDYERLGRADAAADLRAEAEVLAAVLAAG